MLYKRFLTPFRDGIWNRRLVSVGDRGVPSHTAQKPSGIGSLDAYSCPYIFVSDISNIPNASSLLLVCARIAIGVGVLWFCLKPGKFQARGFSRQILGTGVLRCLGTSQTVDDYKPCTIGRQPHTFSFPAPYVIVSDITHALQMATLCMLAHVSSL